jgi:hypothetical protein
MEVYEENMEKSPRNKEKAKEKSQQRKDRRLRIQYYGKSAVGHGTGEQLTPTQKEQVDLYDIILSHLLDEGYAETPESAEVIMVNMSEEWRENIMEREYGPDEKLPGSGLTPSRKYRTKRKKFLKKSKDTFQGANNETGRQRAQRMAQNYYIGTTKQQYDNFGIGN